MAKIRGGEALEEALRNISQKLNKAATLQVGFMEDATNSKTGASIPMYAAINNYGAPSKGIPPRPFFDDMVREKSPGWPKLIATQLVATGYDVVKTLKITGEVMVGQLQDQINNGSYAPLAESTVARKGFDKPLIDTSDMINSATYRVKT
jgi:hypothetical protein